jgi:hypothetical protein
VLSNVGGIVFSIPEDPLIGYAIHSGLCAVFETAEDLEMLEELHTLCNMMTIIRESWVEGIYPVSAT